MKFREKLLWRKGSLTVEASGILSLVTLLIFLVIVVFLFVCIRSCHVLMACETAATHTCIARLSETTSEEEQKLQLLSQKLPVIAEAAGSRVEQKGKIAEFRVRGSVMMPWIFSRWKYEERIQVLTRKPVGTLRKIRSAKKIFRLRDS